MFFFPGLLVIILRSGQKGTGDAEGSGYHSEVEFALASCDSTRGSYAGTRRGARQRGPGTSALAKPLALEPNSFLLKKKKKQAALLTNKLTNEI